MNHKDVLLCNFWEKVSPKAPTVEKSSPTSITSPNIVLPQKLPAKACVLDTSVPGEGILVVVRMGKKYGFTRPREAVDSDAAEGKWLLTDLLSAHHDYLRWRQREQRRKSTRTFRTGRRVEVKCEPGGWVLGKVTKSHRQLKPGPPLWAFTKVRHAGVATKSEYSHTWFDLDMQCT